MATTTFYPSVDGYVGRSAVDEAFSTIRGGTGNTFDDTSSQQNAAHLSSSSTSNQYATLLRALFVFDTSVIGSGRTVESASFNIYTVSFIQDFFGSVGLAAGTTASTSNLANGDYQNNTSATRWATDKTLGSLSTSAYNTFTLNAAGIAGVSTTGYTKIALKTVWDLDNTAPTWASGKTDRMLVQYMEDAQDPYLEVTHNITPFTLTDTATITDSITAIKGKPVTVTDTTTITDSLTTIIGKNATLTDSVSITDTLEANRPWTRQAKNSSTWTNQPQS